MLSRFRAVRRKRLLQAILGVLVVVALGCATYGEWLVHQSDAARAAAAAPVPPSLPATTPKAVNSPSQASSTPVATPTGKEVTSSSPSAISSTTSATPTATVMPQAVPVRPIVPTQVFIPAIGVNAGIEAKASQWLKDPHQGYYAWHYPIPDDMYHIVWWKTGPPLGQPGGMAVFIGHHQIGGFGVFNDLGELKPGQTAMVEGDGLVIHLQAISVQANLPKDDAEALPNAIDHHPAGADAAFITCSGKVHGTSHDDNTVVYFAITDATPA